MVKHRRNFRKKPSSRLVKMVKKISRSQSLKVAESKMKGRQTENIALYHNKPFYLTRILDTSQGLGDPTNYSTQASRIGDEIWLRNVSFRLWVSNKNDRPNVMYRFVLFWYNTNMNVDDALVFSTQQNKMLDRFDTENISVISTKMVKSLSSYSTGVSSDAGSAKEHSQLLTMNKFFPNLKKIQYNADGSTDPKHRNIGLCVTAYDAWGTLQTDNIATIAYDYRIVFKDP